jgi:hypothetical protein
MGNPPAVYAHADQVAALTDRIRRDHPQALAWATEQVDQLSAALGHPERARGYTALWLFVVAHQHLTGGLLAERADRDTVADDVLTAALYLASGIDWTAFSINVRRLDTGAWRVAWTDGSHLRDVPVDDPGTATAVPA